jgi:hypothetical protein
MAIPYTAEPRDRPTADELRARIPGWGVDLDPADRPSVPRERPVAPAEGVHWTEPDQQPAAGVRERSIEHDRLTPVFGTSCPPRGVSGMVRKLAYRRFSEARAAHWLLLVAADRIDAGGAHLRSFATLRPDNPITQTGIRSEVTHGGFRSRLGHRRVDLVHQPMDVAIVAAPWVLGGVGLLRVARRFARRRV